MRTGGVEQLAPFDRLRQDAPQAVQFPVHRRRFERLGRRLVAVAAPFAGEPIPFELLDPVRRDLVQDERAERPIQRQQNLTIALDAALVEFGVVLDVRLGEATTTAAAPLICLNLCVCRINCLTGVRKTNI
jgi:hypothetical protein